MARSRKIISLFLRIDVDNAVNELTVGLEQVGEGHTFRSRTPQGDLLISRQLSNTISPVPQHCFLSDGKLLRQTQECFTARRVFRRRDLARNVCFEPKVLALKYMPHLDYFKPGQPEGSRQ